jgi:Tfp pilus assembly protein PilZ
MGFSLPTGERVECKGVVRWVREVNDQHPDVFPGIGVQFAELDPRAQQAIEQFIQQRDPMFYVE